MDWLRTIHLIDKGNNPSERVAEKLGSRWPREESIPGFDEPVDIHGQIREESRARLSGTGARDD